MEIVIVFHILKENQGRKNFIPPSILVIIREQLKAWL